MLSNNKLKIYEKYMKKCIALAKKGAGRTSPNPMVGAIILDENLNFVSQGYHEQYGQAHAEVNAINSALAKGVDLKNSTIIVTLEPCSHYGKTPPCADLIIKSGIKTVVVGTLDCNPKVSGNGVKKCTFAGLDVIVGVLEKDCLELNEIFFKNQLEKRPFITIKTATTLDGKIATRTGSSKWITGAKSRGVVQQLRNSYDAILTSSATVIVDNPSLTCRMKNGKNPIRVILDSDLKTNNQSAVYNDDGTRVIIATISQEKKFYSKNVEILIVKEKDGKIDLSDLVEKLYQQGVCSILVEAGGVLNGAFLKEKLVDRFIHFIAPKILGDDTGKTSVRGFDLVDINDSLNLKLVNMRKVTPDIMCEYKVLY